MRASYIVFNALRDLVNGRVFIAPRVESEDQAVPYITQQNISTLPENTLDGYTGHDRVRVQIDVYDHDYSNAELLMHRVKRALNHASGSPLIVESRSSKDPETKLYRLSVDVFFSEVIQHG